MDPFGQSAQNVAVEVDPTWIRPGSCSAEASSGVKRAVPKLLPTYFKQWLGLFGTGSAGRQMLARMGA